jgi:hypothetical protein
MSEENILEDSVPAYGGMAPQEIPEEVRDFGRQAEKQEELNAARLGFKDELELARAYQDLRGKFSSKIEELGADQLAGVLKEAGYQVSAPVTDIREYFEGDQPLQGRLGGEGELEQGVAAVAQALGLDKQQAQGYLATMEEVVAGALDANEADVEAIALSHAEVLAQEFGDKELVEYGNVMDDMFSNKVSQLAGQEATDRLVDKLLETGLMVDPVLSRILLEWGQFTKAYGGSRGVGAQQGSDGRAYFQNDEARKILTNPFHPQRKELIKQYVDWKTRGGS